MTLIDQLFADIARAEANSAYQAQFRRDEVRRKVIERLAVEAGVDRYAAEGQLRAEALARGITYQELIELLEEVEER